MQFSLVFLVVFFSILSGTSRAETPAVAPIPGVPKELEQIQGMQKYLAEAQRELDAMTSEEKKDLAASGYQVVEGLKELETGYAGLTKNPRDWSGTLLETADDWQWLTEDANKFINGAITLIRAYKHYPHTPVRDFDVRIARLIQAYGAARGASKPPQAGIYLSTLEKLPLVLDAVAQGVNPGNSGADMPCAPISKVDREIYYDAIDILLVYLEQLQKVSEEQARPGGLGAQSASSLNARLLKALDYFKKFPPEDQFDLRQIVAGYRMQEVETKTFASEFHIQPDQHPVAFDKYFDDKTSKFEQYLTVRTTQTSFGQTLEQDNIETAGLVLEAASARDDLSEEDATTYLHVSQPVGRLESMVREMNGPKFPR